LHRAASYASINGSSTAIGYCGLQISEWLNALNTRDDVLYPGIDISVQADR
jgi:hypothetical protein